ncbi:MAG TPA: GNAT family N-acetyltransferase [Candidatus Eisenbacteria bacterium]|nr:GNAT family N-acetyltransferase [Candidatus Eisenbacteria bacterium]
MSGVRFEIHPVTPDRWADLEALFGPRGACAGCWCMFWKLPRGEFDRGKGEGNRRALRAIVRGGEVPGLLAYAGGEPVGWCAVEPRAAYAGLSRSRVLAPVDETPVWSVPCFFIARGWRRKGVTVRLLRAAAAHAAARGASFLEGYPIAPAKGAMADAFAWTGLVGAFEKAGFEEVARRSATRPIMRKRLRRIASRRPKGSAKSRA